MDVELENIRAALSWFHEHEDYEALQTMAGSLGVYWMDRGLLTEMRTWLERSLESDVKSRHYALVLNRVSGVAYLQGRYKEARSSAEESLETARRIDDLPSVQRAMQHLANALEAGGSLEESWTLETEALEIARKLKEERPRMLLVALINLGYGALIRQMLDDAVRYSEEAVVLAEELSESADGAAARCNLALALIELGRFEDASSVGSTALASALNASDPPLATDCLEVVAAAEALRGDYWSAARLLGASEAIRSAVGFELEPAESALHDRTIEIVRRQLEGSELMAARAEGARSMDVEQALSIVAR